MYFRLGGIFMKQYSHIASSVALGMGISSLFSIFYPIGPIYYLFIFFYIVIAKIPDSLNYMFGVHKRRFLTHSLLSPLWLLMIASILFLLGSFNFFLGLYICTIFYGIIALHFFLDSLNPSGVPLFPNRYVS